VVPNLYPAFERQEVVVHSPRHVRTFAQLTDEELAAVADAWHARARAARDEGDFPYLHPLINEGATAGSSLPHSHSQIVYLREPPPTALAERERGGCAACAVVGAAGSGLALEEDSGAVAYVHPAGRLPYELVIVGPHHDLDLGAALRLLRRCIAALRAVEGPVAWNAWLHEAWQGHGIHPHLEVLPRLSVLAGVELGAGIYVNTVAPEDAAAALRAVL
jgi:UDPglucose--hexose-1-phosphate uridylyltransferase